MSEFEPVWKAIDSIKNTMNDHSARLTVCESRQQDFTEKHNTVCDQLKETEKKIFVKIDFLIAEYHKSQGAKGVAIWLPTIISSLVGIIAIYTFISK